LSSTSRHPQVQASGTHRSNGSSRQTSRSMTCAQHQPPNPTTQIPHLSPVHPNISTMGRGMAILGPIMAGAFGVFTSNPPTHLPKPAPNSPKVYSTLQPELVKSQALREETDPAFVSQHPREHLQHEQQAAEAQRDTAISRAMAQDFKEAGEQITQGGGFAWGIRRAIFGGGKGGEEKEEK
jgi:hypothetical protein